MLRWRPCGPAAPRRRIAAAPRAGASARARPTRRAASRALWRRRWSAGCARRWARREAVRRAARSLIRRTPRPASPCSAPSTRRRRSCASWCAPDQAPFAPGRRALLQSTRPQEAACFPGVAGRRAGRAVRCPYTLHRAAAHSSTPDLVTWAGRPGLADRAAPSHAPPSSRSGAARSLSAWGRALRHSPTCSAA